MFGLAAAVGAGVGLLSVGFQQSVEVLEGLLRSLAASVAGRPLLGWVLPAAATAALCGGAFWLVRRVAPEAGGSGVQEIEGALAGVRPLRWRRVLPVKFVGGVLALGGGMVLGREGPTVQMGGSVGAMLGEFARVRDDGRHVLVAAGAAAGLAAAFNAPLAGVLFVIEEMRPQFRYGFLSFQCVLLASVCSDIVVRAFTGQAPVLHMVSFANVPLASLWLFALFGALLGVLAIAFSKGLVALLDRLDPLTARRRLAFAVCIGGLIGFGGWLDADSVGSGYRTIADALSMRVAVSGLALLLAVRFVLTLLCYGSGVPGGIFSPMLALGTLFGLAFGLGGQELVPALVEQPAVFAVAGMAAFFAATVRAPITGIVLTLEMSGDFQSLLPVMAACLTASFVAEALGGRPIYEVLLERTLARDASQAGTA